MKKSSIKKEYDPECWKDSYVCFIDILGFGDEIKKNGKDTSRAKNIGELLYKLKYSDEISKVSRFEVSILAVSDSIILTSPKRLSSGLSNDTTPISNIMTVAKVIQLLLLITDFRLSRGYIAEGFCYHKDDILYGPAYIEAYEKESKNPDPKIIIQKNVAEKFLSIFGKQESPPDNEKDIIAEIENGPYFVNFFDDIEVILKSREKAIKQLQKFINESQVKAKYCVEIIGVSEKYQWLTDYARRHLERVQNL